MAEKGLLICSEIANPAVISCNLDLWCDFLGRANMDLICMPQLRQSHEKPISQTNTPQLPLKITWFIRLHKNQSYLLLSAWAPVVIHFGYPSGNKFPSASMGSTS